MNGKLYINLSHILMVIDIDRSFFYTCQFGLSLFAHNSKCNFSNQRAPKTKILPGFLPLIPPLRYRFKQMVQIQTGGHRRGFSLASLRVELFSNTLLIPRKLPFGRSDASWSTLSATEYTSDAQPSWKIHRLLSFRGSFHKQYNIQ